MKFVIAPDSFKNCPRASAVCFHLAAGTRSSAPAAELLPLPLADGGEGTTEAVAEAAAEELHTAAVTGPFGEPVKAPFAVLPDGAAVLEMAAASGLEVADGRLDPLRATTFGTGELFRYLLDLGVRDFVIGIGGSATVDGGAGMLQALGGKLLDRSGRRIPSGAGGGRLPEVARLDLSGLDPRLAKSRIRIASDVTNPLCGAQGAAPVFGPQKGASPEQVKLLDAALAHWAELCGDDGATPGDGAAGGLGFALRKLLGGKMESGAELMLELTDFDRRAAGADFILTGEGRSDRQSLAGKLPGIVARHARKLEIPAILVSGALGPGTEELEKEFAACFSIAAGPGPLPEALAAAPRNLTRIGRAIGALTSIKNTENLHP